VLLPCRPTEGLAWRAAQLSEIIASGSSGCGRHIRANLDGPLNLDELADIACLSRFHWHRTYRGMTGETVWQTVRRLRLHRAASELVNGTLPIEEIAVRSGYTNPRAFSQAFKSDFGLPPLRYRAEGGHRRYDNPDWQETEDMYDVRMEDHGPVTIAGLMHTGPYIDVGATFERFGSHLAVTGGWEKSAGMAAVYFSDPDITPPEELKSLAGMALKPGGVPPERGGNLRAAGGPLCGADPQGSLRGTGQGLSLVLRALAG
jgi:AraC family transcriptional regulator